MTLSTAGETASAEQAESGPQFNFDIKSQEFLRDPFPYFHRLREQAPIYEHVPGTWMLTRHRDCRTVLEDPRIKNTLDVRCYPDADDTETHRPVDPDNNAYATMRKLITRKFTPGALRKIEERIEQVAHEVIDAAVAKGDVDFVEDVAYPLGLGMVCEYMGMPREEHKTFREWADHALRGADGLLEDSEELFQAREDAKLKFSKFMREIIEMKRKERGDDLFSELVRTLDDIDPEITYMELPRAFVSVLVSGYETSASFFCGTVRAFIDFPEERQRFLDDPEIRPTGIEELMRYCSPAWYIVRQAHADIELDGHTLKNGDTIIPVLAAANRDPEAFPEPDRVILDRKPNKHVAFGHGPHACFAASLTKLEARIGLPVLLRKASNIKITGEPTYKDTLLVRNYATMPVSLR